MTPDVARALLTWDSELRMRDVRLAPNEVVTHVKILPASRERQQVLLDFLWKQFRPDQFILTSDGWGLPVVLLKGIIDQAHEIVRLISLAEVADARRKDAEDAAQESETPLEPSRRPAVSRRRCFIVWKLCDPVEVEAQLKRVSDSHRERRRVLEALLARPIRYLPRTTPSHVRTVMNMQSDFPNFAEVIDVLADGLSLRARMKAPLKIPATLMMGAPGLGKTAFSKELARRLGFELCVRSLAEMTAAFVLIGGSSSWSESRPGVISMFLADMRDDRAPLLMLDELDKVRSGSNFPPDVALLGLLEDHTARTFRDEHLDLALNVEPLSHLLTGNRVEPVRPEILSRLQKADIRMPTEAEMKAIVASVDKILRQEAPGLAAAFAPLSEEVRGCLSVMPPRRLRSILQGAYARVARRDFEKRGKLLLTAADMQIAATVPEESSSPLPRVSRGFVVPLLVRDPLGWWRVH